MNFNPTTHYDMVRFNAAGAASDNTTVTPFVLADFDVLAEITTPCFTY
jgi:hypothetical protein